MSQKRLVNEQAQLVLLILSDIDIGRPAVATLCTRLLLDDEKLRRYSTKCHRRIRLLPDVIRRPGANGTRLDR